MKKAKTPPVQRRTKPNQYLHGTDVLWMAHYRDENNPESGAMDGMKLKISGEMVEAAIVAQKHADEHGLILQCLRRRY